MTDKMITQEQIDQYACYLRAEERSQETIHKYLRDVQYFCVWLNGGTVTKEAVSLWKESMKASGKAAVTVNGALAALHSFFAMMGWNDCRVKYLKIQRKMFRDVSKELNRDEYNRLVTAANAGKNARLALLLEAICSTGIRVSEVRYP